MFNWHLSKQGICGPVPRDHIAGSDLELIELLCFNSFENCTVKLSAKETKWTSLMVRTHPTFLETLISKYHFGPVKLPGLSRNGLQGRVVWKLVNTNPGLKVGQSMNFSSIPINVFLSAFESWAPGVVWHYSKSKQKANLYTRKTLMQRLKNSI